MSEILDKAVTVLSEKLGDAPFGATVKFAVEGEGAVLVEGEHSPPRVSIGDRDADVTISASQETFRKIVTGELNPTVAAMSGQIRIDGDLSAAMKLAGMLA